MPNALLPRYPVPSLNVPLVNGERFSLGANPGERFDLIVFYRGLHCPICAKYLIELERLSSEFTSRGVQVLAVSSDDKARGKEMSEKVKASGTKFGYGLSLRSARQWGLYISASRGKTSIGIEEPVLFSEPGVFLVRPDGTLYLRLGSNYAVRRTAIPGPHRCYRFRGSQRLFARGEFTAEV